MSSSENNLCVVTYARVSTQEQADDGVSLQMQENKCLEYASLHDLAVADSISDEGQSAATTDRPGLQLLLSHIRGGAVSGIVIYKLDRLSRNIVDFGSILQELDDHNVKLHSVSDHIDTSTATGRLVVNIMISVAQWERETVIERTRATIDHIKEQGFHVGNPPFGWSLSPHDGPGNLLTPDPVACQIIYRARDLRSQDLSLRAIGAVLHDLWPSIPPHAERVRRILASPLPEEMIQVGQSYMWPARRATMSV